MHEIEIRQEVFTFAQAQSSAGDIDAMRKQLGVLQRERETLEEALKESVEYTDLKECKAAIKSVEEQIAQATGALVDGLVNK